MTKQKREELVKQMEQDYEDLHKVLLSLGDFLAYHEGKENPSQDIGKKLQQAHDVIDECVGALYSLIPDPEDS